MSFWNEAEQVGHLSFIPMDGRHQPGDRGVPRIIRIEAGPQLDRRPIRREQRQPQAEAVSTRALIRSDQSENAVAGPDKRRGFLRKVSRRDFVSVADF
jgi:hypothetical protein